MRTAILSACVLAFAGVVGLRSQSPAPIDADAPVVYENARLIPGDGSAVIERAAILVDKRVILRVGAVGSFAMPPAARRVDLSASTRSHISCATR